MVNGIVPVLCLLGILIFNQTVFASPYSLYGSYKYADGSYPSLLNMSGTVGGESIPSESFTFDTNEHNWFLQLGSTNWNVGDLVHIDFDDGAGATASIDWTIPSTDPPYYNYGMVSLTRTVIYIEFTTIPANLYITIDGTQYHTPYTLASYEGVQHTIHAHAQSGGAGKQYVFNNWSIGGDSSQTYTVPSGSESVTATFETQYKLTVSSSHGSLNGNGYYTAGTSANFEVTSTEVAGGSGEQFIFTGWTGSGIGAYNGSASSYSVTMNNPISETANWQTQYQLATVIDPTGGGTITADPSAEDGWYNDGTGVELTAHNNTGYTFNGFTGGGLSGTTNPQSVTMDAAKTVTAHFGHEVNITVKTDPAGLTYYVDDNPYTAQHTFTWPSGEVHKLQVVNTTQNGSTGTRYNFSQWDNSGGNPQNYSAPTSDATITADFTTQYELTVESTHGSPTGTGWYNSGTQAPVSVTSPDEDGTTRYVLSGWSGAYTGANTSFNVTMDGPKTVTADWDTEYYLTVDSEHGSPTGEGWKASGANASFSVTSPDVDGTTRYQFQNWTGAYSGTATSGQVTMSSAKTVTANWLTQYYLTTSENPDAGGDISPAPPGAWYDANSTANLNATVNSGYDWAGWSGSLSGSTRPTTLVMNGSKSVVANFQVKVQITVNTSIAGIEYTVDGTTYTGEHLFNWVVGSTHTFTTTSNQLIGGTNYVFISWSDGGARSHTYTVPSGNATVTATFQEKQEATLTMQPNPVSWGTTEPSAGDHVYDIGDVVNITAIPEPGYKFKYWSNNVTNHNLQSTTVQIDNDKTVIAYFGKQDFTLTMAADPAQGGETVPPVGDHTYNTSSVVELTAIPNPGWRFVEWVGNVADSTREQTSITILSNETVTAKFEQIRYTLDVSVSPQASGSTTPSAGQHEYAANSVVDLTAVPGAGYRFVNWNGDVDDPNDPTTTITMSANKSVTANFELDQFNLNMAASPVEGGTTDPAAGVHTLAANSVIEISATPNEGYRFGNWTGGVADANAASTSITLNSDKTVTANFIRLGDVRVTTEPEGLRMLVDGQPYTSPHDFEWVNGSNHIIAIDSTTQYDGELTQYLFQAWSDEGATEHEITVGSVPIYTARFNTKYYLSTAVSPLNGGSMTPAPPGGWYDMDVNVSVNATADTLTGYRFSGWSGSLTGKARPDTVIMDGPKSVTAEFSKVNRVWFSTLPESLSITVDGQQYKTPIEFWWEDQSGHTIATDTLKSGGVGVRYHLDHWSDGKAPSHTVTTVSDTGFIAIYTTQYRLTTDVEPEEGGMVEPEAPGGWYNSGTPVALAATANAEAGYMFVNWQGDVNSIDNPVTVKMDSAITATAVFSMGDYLAPWISNTFPANGARNVPRNTPIQFKIRDDGSGINLATLMFKLNDQDILRNGADQTGGQVQVNYKNKSCTVYYQPATELPADSQMVVRVQCEDSSPAANFMDSTITFHVGGARFVHTSRDTITTAGGSVTDDTTGITVDIPASALRDTTEITISVVDDYPPLPPEANGLALGVHFGPAGLVFDDSVTISIPYNQELLDNAGVAGPEELVIYYYSMLKDKWSVLDILSFDESFVYVKVKEFCYLVYGVNSAVLPKPARPDGLTELNVNAYYSFSTRRVISPKDQPVQYRFDWGDGYQSLWSADTSAAHKWLTEGDYGIVAFARSTLDTSKRSASDTLWVHVSIINAIKDAEALPTIFKLDQNFPNPFNPETTIRFQLPLAEHVVVEIYNINGQRIRTLVNDQRAAGYYSLIWNGQNDSGLRVSTGLYFVRMKAGGYVHTVKMSFLK